MTTNNLTRVAMIAAIYVVLCLVPGLSMIAYGPIQVRIAEALTLLPLLDRKAIAGVTLGCFLANLVGILNGMNPTGVIDLLFGTLATFLAGICTYYFRNQKVKGIPLLSCSMPIIFNAVIIGAELAYILMPNNFMIGWLMNGVYVALGELIAVVFGYFII